MNVVTWLDAFRAALERLEDDVEFRRSLPADGAGADGSSSGSRRASTRTRCAPPTARAGSSRGRPVLDGLLSDLRALDQLGPDDAASSDARP